MPFRAHRKRVFRWMQICAPIIYTMLKTCTPYNEECFEQRRLRCERKRANRLVNELQKLGYVVVAPDWCLLPYCSASDRQGLPLFVSWIFHLWGVEKRFVKLGDMIMSLRIYAISRGMVGIYKKPRWYLHRYHRGTFFVVAIGGLIFQTAAFATCAKSS